MPAEHRGHVTEFIERDLAEPLDLERSFALALCLEVAEHLPPERAPGLVADLTALAPVVLFSAAVPGQGGTGHVNEQWSEYWVALFDAEGWSCRDAIRPWVRANADVAWWYRQNLFLAVGPSVEPAYTSFPRLAAVRPEHPVDYLVRPAGDVMTPPAPPVPEPEPRSPSPSRNPCPSRPPITSRTRGRSRRSAEMPGVPAATNGEAAAGARGARPVRRGPVVPAAPGLGGAPPDRRAGPPPIGQVTASGSPGPLPSRGIGPSPAPGMLTAALGFRSTGRPNPDDLNSDFSVIRPGFPHAEIGAAMGQREIDAAQLADAEKFEAILAQYLAGEVEEDAFRIFRLNNGIYGQRQGGHNQMVRVKIPWGGVLPDQLEMMAHLADTYSRGWGHITTRQNVQFHYVQLEKIPEVMRLLGSVGMTSREACGDTVRNVMGCHLAGACPHEKLDITPWAEAAYRHFVRNPLGQRLPRKFKINFSGCATDCGQAHVQRRRRRRHHPHARGRHGRGRLPGVRGRRPRRQPAPGPGARGLHRQGRPHAHASRRSCGCSTTTATATTSCGPA